MNDKERRKLDKALRGVDSRMKFRVDEGLTYVRNWWDHWSKEERKAFKAWINELVKVKKKKPSLPPYISLRLEFSEPMGDGDHYTVTPPIEAVKRAIACWERGKPYVPKSLGELTG